MTPQPEVEVLLVDDNPADLDLITEALGRRNSCHFTAAHDGEEALTLLEASKQNRDVQPPAFIVLDLNLPRKDGRAVLAQLKSDPALRSIPVVVFTTSQAPRDIARAYDLGANCYVSKPGNLQEFLAVVKSLDDFWFTAAQLPRRVPL